MRRLSRNSLFVVLARGLELVAAYFGVVAVARYLSLDDFGNYSYVLALVTSIMAISYFGTQQALIREVARDRGQARAYLGVALLLRLGLGLLSALGAVAAALALGLEGDLLWAVVIVAACEVFFVLALLLRAVFQAFEQMQYEPLVTTVHGLLLVAGVYLVLRFDLGFLWLMAALGLPKLGQCALAAALAFGRLARPSFQGVGERLKPFVQAALVIGLTVFLYQNIFRVNVFLLKAFGTLEQLALFQAPHSFVLQLQVIPISLATALFPALARLLHSQPQEARALFARLFRLVLVGCAWLALNMSLFASQFMALVFGPRYLESSSVMAVVAWSLLPLSLDMLFGNALVALNRQRYALYGAGMVIGLNLAAGPLLIPVLGHLGAAWMSLASYALLFAWSWLFTARGGFAVAVGPDLARALAACAAAWAAALLARPLGLAAEMAAAQAIFLAAALALGLLKPRRAAPALPGGRPL